MTFDECQAVLDEIRRRQGTDRPLSGSSPGASWCEAAWPGVRRGRRNPSPLSASSSSSSRASTSGPAAMVQIASIPEDGLSEIESP